MADPSDHDLLIDVRKDVEHILKALVGNGQEGLTAKVDRLDTAITKHDVYFALVGAGLLILGAVLTERLIG